MVQTDTSVPRNLIIRFETKNQVEFIQQSGDKLHDFRYVVYIDEPM